MSTRDRAISIIDKLSDEQLEYFIKLFGSFVDAEAETDISRASYLALKKMIKPMPDLDYEKELAEHREEKYGH